MVALVGLQTSLLRYDLLYIFCDLAKSWKIDTYIVQLEVPGFKNNYIINREDVRGGAGGACATP